MSDLKQKIIQLLSSRHYHNLATYRPPFEPLNVLGIAHRELSFSSVLGWLLSDPENKEFRHAFLLLITTEIGLNSANGLDQPIIVRREYGDDEAGRIDVFVQLESLDFVVAIEIKVKASEGHDQISRYQEFLLRRYRRNNNRAVVYITPFGRSPATASELSEVPVLNISWETIAEILDDCTGHGEIHDFRIQFSKHIRRSVLMHRDEKKIVIDFLKEGDNAKTIRRIMEYLPDLGEEEYTEEYKRIVANVLSLDESDLKLDKYVTKGSTRELKIRVKKWNKAGMPFTLMLYNYKTTALRVLIWSGEYEINAELLKNLSRTSQGIVGNFPKVSGWTCWRSVIATDGDREVPQESIVGYEIFHDKFWEKVEVRLREQIGHLLPLVQNYLAVENL